MTATTTRAHTLVYPVTDLDAAVAAFSALLGQPHTSTPYYVGFRAGRQEVGLDPIGAAQGLTGPVPSFDVDDISPHSRRWSPPGRPSPASRATSAAGGSSRSRPTQTATPSACCRTRDNLPLVPDLADISALAARLRAAGCVYAEDEARLLTEATQDPGARETLVARRVAGEPLEHLLGWAEFCGVRVRVAPGVFVPRPRTELLVRQALLAAGPNSLVVDLCCGSAAIGLVLAARLGPTAEVHAADVDPTAVACARLNLDPVGGRVHEGDLFDALPQRLRGHVDVLVANVPYVPTAEVAAMPAEARDHEPRVALDGGADGLHVVRRVARAAPAWLAPGGTAMVETGRDQAASAAAAFEAAGLAATVVDGGDVYAVTGRSVR